MLHNIYLGVKPQVASPTQQLVSLLNSKGKIRFFQFYQIYILKDFETIMHAIINKKSAEMKLTITVEQLMINIYYEI